MQLRVTQSALPGFTVAFALDIEVIAVVAECWKQLTHFLLNGFRCLRPALQHELDSLAEYGVRASVAYLSRRERGLRLTHHLIESALGGRPPRL